MRKIGKDQLDEDFEVLRRMRKSPVIDRIKWVDATKTSGSIPGVKKYGDRVTIQDVNARSLAALAAQVPDAPIALVEIAIDFWPPRSEGSEDRSASLVRAFMALQRRLVPGSGAAQSSRAIAIDRAKPKHRNFLHADAGRIAMTASGSVVLRERKPLSPFVPRRKGGRIVSSHTIYFGHKPKESWSHLPEQPPSMAQVRLYIKTKDQDVALPDNEHRVRLEVTLNGAALVECLGINTISELADVNLRPLATSYLRLASPVAARSMLRVRGRRNLVMQVLLKARVEAIAAADAAGVIENGNFTGIDQGLIDLRTVPRMTELIADALYDYTRAVRRARNSGRIATVLAKGRVKEAPKHLICIEDLDA